MAPFSQIFRYLRNNHANDSGAFLRLYLNFSEFRIAYERYINCLQLGSDDQSVFDAVIRQETNFRQYLSSITIGPFRSLPQTLISSATEQNKLRLDLCIGNNGKYPKHQFNQC